MLPKNAVAMQEIAVTVVHRHRMALSGNAVRRPSRPTIFDSETGSTVSA